MTRSSHAPHGWLALLACALAAPVSAAAQPAPAPATADSDWLVHSAAGKRAFEAGRLEEALAAYRQALAACQRACPSDGADLAINVESLGIVLAELERPAEAEPHLRRSLALAERNLVTRPDLFIAACSRIAPAGRCQRGMATLADVLQDLGQFEEAERLYDKLTAARALISGEAHPETLRLMDGRAQALAELRRYAEAEALITRAIGLSTRAFTAEHRNTLTLARTLAVIRFQKGDKAAADADYLRIADRQERTLGANHKDTLHTLQLLAWSYLTQGRLDEAEGLLNRVLAAGEAGAAADPAVMLAARDALAQAYLERGDPARAEPILREVLAERRRMFGNDSRFVLVSLNNLGSALAAKGDLAAAESLKEQELAGSRALLGSEHPDTLTSMRNLAALRWDQNRLREAEPVAAEALAISERALGPSHPSTLAAARSLVFVRLGKGRTHPREPGWALLPPTPVSRDSFGRGTGDALEPARTLLAAARAARDLYVRSGGAEQGGTDAQLNEAYSLYADATFWRGFDNPPERATLDAEAFVVLQEAMNGAASQAIVRVAARRFAQDSRLDTLIRELETVIEHRERNAADFALSFTAGDAAAAADRGRLRSERAALDARKAELEAQLRSRFPDYFTLIQPNPVGLAAAQTMLGDDEAILMVVPGPLTTQVVVVTSSGIARSISNWSAANMADAVRRLRWDLGAQVRADAQVLDQLRARDPPDGPLSFDRRLALRLYQQLTHGIAGSLAGKKKVFVAAGGALSGLPFSVLVTQEPQGADHDPVALRATAWLADQHALVHIPSVRALALLRGAALSRAPGGPGAFRGYGDPRLDGPPQERGPRSSGSTPDASEIFGDAPAAGASSVDVTRLRRMARLPGTARELEDIRRTLGAPRSSVLLGPQANETAVRTADLSQVRLLAFATHGLTTGEVDGLAEPGLVLTPPPEGTAADDGFLAASEVSALRLDADWVILSACNTATGEGAEGQGLSGLARAFFYAGARNLLASHWPVSDEVAPVLIARTLELEQSGQARAQALQQAMREVRTDAARDSPGRSWAHPFFWAPFVLIGGEAAPPAAASH